MVMKLLLLLMVSLLCLATEATPRPEYLVKPKCKAKCGNVVIPFPFGIGKGCHLNDWYSIECRKASDGAEKPFLNPTKLNLEVLDVSLDFQTVTVSSPIAPYDQQENGSSRFQLTSMNLEDTPFLFSRFDNIFLVLGCGRAELLDQERTLLSGCISSRSLDNRTATGSGCYGINCCQTSIPTKDSYYLSTYNLNFAREDHGGNTSSTPMHAFLVDADWLPEPKGFSGVKYAPLTLLWTLKMGDRASSRCNGSIIYQSSSKSYVRYSCGCPFRYEGNPYLPNGCNHVIKECATCLTTCEYEYQTFLNGSSYYDYQRYFCPEKNLKDKLRALILGCSISGGSMFLLFGCFGLYKVAKKQKEVRRKKLFFKRNGGLLLEQQISSNEATIEKIKIFTFKELKKATDNFNLNRVLGQGGQGTVYKGMLADGRIVAVKKSVIVDENQIEHYINEIVILSQINHRNIVKLLGCCLEAEVPLLVYEFVANGTLFQYIHNQDTNFPFPWKKRLQIASEAAGALSYLHSACSIPIYHKDIKSINILLDDKYRAKVSDFGTSRSISIGQTHLTTRVQGTFGYFDPEYFRSSQFTEKSDVYSFGVVLAELLTGQKAICSTKPQKEKSLAMHFILALQESRLLEILDARVVEEGGKEEITRVAYLAYRCLNLSGRERPTMKEVFMELEHVRVSPPPLKAEKNFEDSASIVGEITRPDVDGILSSAGPWAMSELQRHRTS